MSLFTTDDYRQALQALIPTGRAWPRDPDTVQYAVLRSLAASYQRSDSDALSILSGAFPKTATVMLPEWEEALGLPDDCSNITIKEYRQARAGLSVCGDGLNGDEWPFVWLVEGEETNISYARVGLSYCGDPLRSWGNRQLECRLSALSPSYTLVKFGYIYFGFNDEGVYEVTPEFATIFDIASGYISEN